MVTVFLVEDNFADVELVREVFRSLAKPCDIRHYATVQDAAEAARLAGNDGRQVPDLILVDYNLPGGSGLDVLAATAANPRLRDVPTAILSSFVLPEEANEAARLGAYCVISKPVSLKDFLQDVGAAIGKLLDGKTVPARREGTERGDRTALDGCT